MLDDLRGDVTRLRLQLLGQGQGHIGLEVRELAAPDHRVASCEVLAEGMGEGGGETVREHRSQRWHEPILLPRASCLSIGSGPAPPGIGACNVGHVTYLRYPHVHADLITFTADDDVWLVESAGGRAWRLTSDRVPVRSPRISPDGAHVAFVSFRTGQPELMVAEVATGALRRLTWLGSTTMTMLGWHDSAHVLVAANAGEFEVRNHVVKAVGLDGGVERLEFGRASGLARHHSGVTALSTPFSRPPAHWKRYRGGTAPRLWLDRVGGTNASGIPDGSGARWQRLLREDEASLTDPLWVGDSLVFTSDRAATFPHHAQEQANLWIIDGLATAASASGSGAGAGSGAGTGSGNHRSNPAGSPIRGRPRAMSVMPRPTAPASCGTAAVRSRSSTASTRRCAHCP